MAEATKTFLAEIEMEAIGSGVQLGKGNQDKLQKTDIWDCVLDVVVVSRTSLSSPYSLSQLIFK